jgi:ABC-type dipeptide/oligopeptide/nickel transport system permease subunit
MSTAGAIIAGTQPKGDTLGRRAWRRFRSSRLNIICVVIIAAYLLLALLGYTGTVPDFQQQVGAKFSPPDLHKPALWLGADLFGRSILYKLFAGAKTAMTLGLLVACISLPLGLFMGAVAGYFGGKIDALVQWVYSVIVSVPYILLIIAISYILGKGMLAICVAMGVVGWVGLCRMTRAEFMKLREREFVLASRLLGASDFRLIFIHILPNVMHIALVAASMEIMGAIKAEVILTFLGVGVQDGASWGQMISDAPGELMIGVWWPTVGVSFTLFLIVFALNRVGDALRDALDPRLV